MAPTTYDRTEVVSLIQAAIAPYERRGKFDNTGLAESKSHLATLRALQAQHGLSDDDVAQLVEPQMESQDHRLDGWRNLEGFVEEPPVHYALNTAIDRKRDLHDRNNFGMLSDDPERTARDIVKDHDFLTRLIGAKYGWQDVNTLQYFQIWYEG